MTITAAIVSQPSSFPHHHPYSYRAPRLPWRDMPSRPGNIAVGLNNTGMPSTALPYHHLINFPSPFGHLAKTFKTFISPSLQNSLLFKNPSLSTLPLPFSAIVRVLEKRWPLALHACMHVRESAPLQSKRSSGSITIYQICMSQQCLDTTLRVQPTAIGEDSR